MEPTNKPGYLNDAIRFAAILGLTATVLSTLLAYQFINSDPSGSIFTPVSMAGVFVCLIGALTGLLTVRAYAKGTGLPMKAGEGAVMGIVSGVIFAVFTGLISLIWNHLIDPTFTDRLLDAMVANFEAMSNIPAETKDAMIDAMHTEFQKQKTFVGQLTAIGIQAAISAVLNAITGIIGVSVFAKKPEVL